MDQSLLMEQTYNVIDWQTLFTWQWRWLALRLSKRQLPTTVLFRTTLTQTITQYELQKGKNWPKTVWYIPVCNMYTLGTLNMMITVLNLFNITALFSIKYSTKMVGWTGERWHGHASRYNSEIFARNTVSVFLLSLIHLGGRRHCDRKMCVA